MGWREWFRTKAQSLSDTYPESQADVVASYDVSTYNYLVRDGQRYNPDDLVAQKGLPIYAKMLNDEQVKSVTEFKLNAILGRGYQFKFHGHTSLSDEEQKQRIDVFEAVLRHMRGAFVDALEGVASGREFGFSVTEKVYGEIKVDGKAYVGLNMLLTRDPCSFEFYADDYGFLNRIVQKTNGRPDIDISPDKIIHYVHKPKWDMIFGRSELRSAYRSWYAKDQLVKLWLLHLEKFGSGVWKAQIDKDAGIVSGQANHTALQNALKNVKGLASIIFPPGVTGEIVFPTSTDQYQRALEYFDLAIAKSQLVPNLLGLSHTGQTGAYSQSQTQFEAFFWTTSADGQRLAECLNEQLFRDLGDQNWGDGEYPVFCFKPVSMEHTKWMLSTWKDLLGIKAVLPTEEDERIIRQMLEMPERDPEAEPLVDPMAERRMQLEEQAANNPPPVAAPPQLTVNGQPVAVTVNNPAPSQPASQSSENLHVANANREGVEVVPHGTLKSATKEAFSSASRRVMFAVIERRTDDFAVSAVDTLSGIIAKATKRALGDDSSLSQLVDEDQSDVAALDMSGADRSKLKNTFRDLLVQSWELGSDMASNELERARGERMAFKARKAKFASLRDNAAAYFDTQSFRMAGDTSDQVRKIIQQELQNGIKFGKTLPEIRISIWERLISRGLTDLKSVKGVEQSEAIVSALEALQLDDVADVRPYLDTLVRTNTFEALNEARYAEFTDPDVGDFVQALEYAAVLDSSTTEICSELNGSIYRADSKYWDEIRPPNHFNCRSVLIPVTVIDGWDGQESPEPTVEPAVGFK